jgi:integrase
VLRALLRYAAKVGKVTAAPQFEMNKVGDQGFDFLDFDEYGMLVAAQSIEEQLIVVLLGGEAGLRRSEIAGLWWEDVDLRAGQLKVQRQLLEGELLIPKGGKPRTIPLTTRLAKALRAYRHLRSKHVLVREDNTPWTASTFKWRAEAVYTTAALPRFVGKEPPHPAKPWHCLRHTFCSHLAMRGCPPATLQALAGHSDIRTTMRYIHLAPRALTEAIALLNAVEREPDVNGAGAVQPPEQPSCRTAQNGLTIGAGSAR